MKKLWFQFALKVVALAIAIMAAVAIWYVVPFVAGSAVYNIVVLGLSNSFVKWLIGVGVMIALAAGIIGLWSINTAVTETATILRRSALTVLVPPWVTFPPGSLRDMAITRKGKRTLRRMAALYNAEPEAVLLANDNGVDIELLTVRLDRKITAEDARAAGKTRTFSMENTVIDTHTGGKDDV